MSYFAAGKPFAILVMFTLSKFITCISSGVKQGHGEFYRELVTGL